MKPSLVSDVRGFGSLLSFGGGVALGYTLGLSEPWVGFVGWGVAATWLVVWHVLAEPRRRY